MPTPPLYGRPVILSADRHGDLGLRQGSHFAFAGRANAIPIGLSEFALVARHYPIVFSEQSPAVPLAVTGVHEGRNLFVDGDGQWLPGTYVPGYVRRHPFLLVPAADGRSGMLGVDADSDRLVWRSQGGQTDAQPLFGPDGQASPLSAQALALCREVHIEQLRIAAFAAALDAHGLLIANEARFTLADGSPFTLRGFRVIHEAAYRALPEEVAAQFVRQGWSDAVALHWSAAHSWQSLLARQAQVAGADRRA